MSREKRFIFVLVVGYLMNSFAFWLGTEIIHIYDLFMIIIVGIFYPLFTYTSHRFYTFHDQPGKAFKKIVRSRPDSV